LSPGDEREGMTIAVTPPVALVSRRGAVPNTITVVRTIAAVVLSIASLVDRSPALLVGGYATYWIGDMLDGWSARRLDQETRIGAVLDILSDRASAAPLAAAFLSLRPDAAVPIAVFLLQFMVLDCLLSLAFLGWPIKSPNEFGQVDRSVYRLNWATPAKALNTSAVVLAILLGQIGLATALAGAICVIKAHSARRVLTLRNWS
jgi:CDP-diacylglycerol--glycerol-3-phosphate 3-phosphatidyltransferase